MGAWITRAGVRYANEMTVEQMIAAAVQVEREACTSIADAYNDPASEIAYGKDARGAASEIALAIRARNREQPEAVEEGPSDDQWPRTTDKLFEFTFFDGQVFRGRGRDALDALRRLGLGAYNPVAYNVREVTEPD